MQVSGYRKEYDFKIDLEYGHEGEQNLIDFMNSLQNGCVEVKSDRYRNGRIAVEVQHKPHGQWLKSGLAVTTAQWWAYRFAPDSFVMVSVPRLKRYLNANHKRLETRTFAEQSDCPAWGYLLMPQDVHQLMTDTDYD